MFTVIAFEGPGSITSVSWGLGAELMLEEAGEVDGPGGKVRWELMRGSGVTGGTDAWIHPSPIS